VEGARAARTASGLACAACVSILRIASSSASRSRVMSVSASAVDGAKLIEERLSRAIIDRAARFARTAFQPANRTCQQRLIIRHSEAPSISYQSVLNDVDKDRIEAFGMTDYQPLLHVRLAAGTQYGRSAPRDL